MSTDRWTDEDDRALAAQMEWESHVRSAIAQSRQPIPERTEDRPVRLSRRTMVEAASLIVVMLTLATVALIAAGVMTP